jgi:4-hydroxy 2-oxovalerate aldolase
MSSLVFLDCTLRDGGYYNSWDFDYDLVQEYIYAAHDAGVDIVELGFRTLNKKGFYGACAYSTDAYLKSFEIPEGLKVCVMINASEILENGKYSESQLNKLFPNTLSTSITIIRIASHIHEFSEALKASDILNKKGFKVGFNLMQVSECPPQDLKLLAEEASKYSFEVLYFADSLGNMNKKQVLNVINQLRQHWDGPLGIHAHDNMGLGLLNTLFAIQNGVTWVDSTVTGMGRGAGNAKTELLAIEIADIRNQELNIKSLISVISSKFKPLKEKHCWGTNPFYYLSGKNSVHPTYVQEMIGDSRYKEEDIISVIQNLGSKDGKKYSKNTLIEAQNFYSKESYGEWAPQSLLENKEIMLIGSGPGVKKHRAAIESYIQKARPLVIALNAKSSINNDLIDLRIACHPIRLKTDCEKLSNLSKPVIMPASSMPKHVLDLLPSIEILDFGLNIKDGQLVYEKTYCVLSSPLVIGYALAIATSGKAKRLLLAGFDGYSSDNPLRLESELIFQAHQSIKSATPLLAVTPTLFNIESTSIYSM